MEIWEDSVGEDASGGVWFFLKDNQELKKKGRAQTPTQEDKPCLEILRRSEKSLGRQRFKLQKNDPRARVKMREKIN